MKGFNGTVARGRFEIPEAITHIGEQAFAQREDRQGTPVLCSTLKRSLKEVGYGTFGWCNLPATLTSRAPWAVGSAMSKLKLRF